MTTKRKFKLNEKKGGDLEILAYLYQYRRLTIDHLCLLTGRTQTRLTRRLIGLEEYEYIYRQRKHIDNKYVCTIRQKALPILVQHKMVGEEVLDQRIRWHERTDYFREHNVGVTDIHVCLELASRKSHIKLIDWREGKEIEDKFIVRDDGKQKKVTIKPDGFFTLQDTRRPEGSNRADFFLEYDRWTSTNPRFKEKIKKYQSYFEQGLHTKKYGIKNARVLTVGIDEERTVKRCVVAGEVLNRDEGRFYYFTSMHYFAFENPERVFGDIFISPRDFKKGKRYFLIPPLAK